MGYYICSCSKEKQKICSINHPRWIHLCKKANYAKDDGDRDFNKAMQRSLKSQYFPNGDQFWR
jgi:hypothetical protein